MEMSEIKQKQNRELFKAIYNVDDDYDDLNRIFDRFPETKKILTDGSWVR